MKTLDNSHHIHIATLFQCGFSQKELRKYQSEVSHPTREQALLWIERRGAGAADRKLKIVNELTHNFESHESDVKAMISRGGYIILESDNTYPSSLLQMHSPPSLLWARGDAALLQGSLFSIVGSRKSSQYTHRSLDFLLPPLISGGYHIVSGGAAGADSIAHELCMQHGGCTISVFGTGIDRSYPASNQRLFQRILESNGLLISQFPLKTQGFSYNFPMRNEVVAYLGTGLLVTEASQGSGSLITARLALEANKSVFALPGFLDHHASSGANELIRDGQAKLVMNSDDILSELSPSYQSSMARLSVAPSEAITHASASHEEVYNLISSNSGMGMDDIATSTGIALSDLFGLLAEMEIAGLLIQSSQGYVLKSHR